MPTPGSALIEAIRQRDSLARALRKIIRHRVTNGFGQHYVPGQDIDAAQRALDRVFPKPDLTPTGRLIVDSFRNTSTK